MVLLLFLLARSPRKEMAAYHFKIPYNSNKEWINILMIRHGLWYIIQNLSYTFAIATKTDSKIRFQITASNLYGPLLSCI